MNAASTQVIHVPVTISRDEYLRYYQGSAKNVIARDTAGRRVSFPANILQPFVTHTGISGVFAITFDDRGKFQKVERIG